MTPELSELKTELRRRMKLVRDGLAKAARAEAEPRIADRVERWLAGEGRTFGAAATIGLYLPIGSEADPRPAAERLGVGGARLAVPAILGDDLVFRALGGSGPLEPQGFGTLAPSAEAETTEPDLLLVPLLAFDGAGRRIGYGRGFYDRAIARLRARRPGFLAVGIAFEAQRVERVPTDRHDMPLDAVVTESATVRPSAARTTHPPA